MNLGASIGPINIPGTFPTATVLSAIREALPASAHLWTKSKISDMYDLYLEGAAEKIPPYAPGQTQAIKYFQDNSSYSDSEIRVFLMMLYQLSQRGEIDQKYWNIELQEKRAVINTPGITKSLDKFTGAIKWGSILLIGAGVLYISWPLIRKWRKK